MHTKYKLKHRIRRVGTEETLRRTTVQGSPSGNASDTFWIYLFFLISARILISLRFIVILLSSSRIIFQVKQRSNSPYYYKFVILCCPVNGHFYARFPDSAIKHILSQLQKSPKVNRVRSPFRVNGNIWHTNWYFQSPHGWSALTSSFIPAAPPLDSLLK